MFLIHSCPEYYFYYTLNEQTFSQYLYIFTNNNVLGWKRYLTETGTNYLVIRLFL